MRVSLFWSFAWQLTRWWYKMMILVMILGGVVGTSWYKFSESITNLSHLHCSLNNILPRYLPSSDKLITVECCRFDKPTISDFSIVVNIILFILWNNCLFTWEQNIISSSEASSTEFLQQNQILFHVYLWFSSSSS